MCSVLSILKLLSSSVKGNFREMFFLGTTLPMPPLKQTSTSVQKGKISQEISKIGGIIPIPDARVPSDALKKKGCFRVKALA